MRAFTLVAVALLVAAAHARPLSSIPLPGVLPLNNTLQARDGLQTPLPIGQFYGTVGIVPYQYNPSTRTYACTACNAIYSNAYMYWMGNSLTLNISGASSGSCSLYPQGYVFYNLVPHSGGAYPYYYTGNTIIEGSTLPICIYFNGQTFAMTIDGQGTCAVSTAAPVCTSGWQPGTVSQTWAGSFAASVLPTGSWSGKIAIVPYTRSASGYTCTACNPVTSAVTVNWNGDQAFLNIQGASSGSCSVYQQSYLIQQVVDYGAQYPSYYRGGITVEGSYIALCFYWDATGNVRIQLDGQGNCPQPGQSPSCTNGWQAGTVSQVWAATLRRT